jgi:FkbM family methyltransferase
MPSPGRFAGVLRNRHVPLRARAGLAFAEVRRKLRPKSAYALRYGPGTVFLSHDDYAIDWESLKFVAADRAYLTDYAGAIVLDVGAHKGYYGAYALANGAQTVLSFEPESANVELLERAAASYRERGRDWQVRHAAVGAARGEAELHVMGASWGHALHPPDAFAEYEVGLERVTVQAMADVLAEADALAREGARLIVKVNVEGEECGIVLGTPPEAWTRVNELFVEMHPWAKCTASELARHVASTGLREEPSEIAPVLRLKRQRRGAASRSGPRTAPR